MVDKKIGIRLPRATPFEEIQAMLAAKKARSIELADQQEIRLPETAPINGAGPRRTRIETADVPAR